MVKHNDNKTNKITKNGKPTSSANKKAVSLEIVEHIEQDVRTAPSRTVDTSKVAIARPGAVTRSRSGTPQFV